MSEVIRGDLSSGSAFTVIYKSVLSPSHQLRLLEFGELSQSLRFQDNLGLIVPGMEN